jgi:hypothetical protein
VPESGPLETKTAVRRPVIDSFASRNPNSIEKARQKRAFSIEQESSSK